MSGATDAKTDDLKISPREARRRLESGAPVLVLDVRSPDDWQACRLKIQGAIRVPPDQFAIDPGWPRDRFTLAYCSCPHDEASTRVARKLREEGFREAYALEGGFDAWRAESDPVEPEEVDQSDPRVPPEILCPNPPRRREPAANG